MIKIFLGLISILFLNTTRAQHEVILSGNATEDTISSPFSLPIDHASFYPTFQGNYIRNQTTYTMPIKMKSMMFTPSVDAESWLKTKTTRMEGGLGFGYELASSQILLGLNVYKGSIQSETHQVFDPKEKLHVKYPKELNYFSEWREGDKGRYQTYGGVSVSLSAGIGIVNLLNSSVTFQSQFWLEVQKISDQKVLVAIREEKLNRKNVQVGPLVSRAQYSWLKGNQFLYKFQLDLSNTEHHRIYKEALKGNIIEVQDKVKNAHQELSWTGTLKSLYFGIPKVIGQSYNRSQYQMKIDEEDVQLAVDKKENMGFFLPSREHHDLASIEKDKLVLVWKSEMKKVKKKAFRKNIYLKTAAVAPKLLQEDLIPNEIGQLSSIIMASVRWDQLAKMKDIPESELLDDYKVKCEEQKLKCRKNRVAKKVIKKFIKAMKAKGFDHQMDLGKLFMRTPLFFRVVMENLRESYFIKFELLMEKWQSLEGVMKVET
jgi:hypothetical protein